MGNQNQNNNNQNNDQSDNNNNNNNNNNDQNGNQNVINENNDNQNRINEETKSPDGNNNNNNQSQENNSDAPPNSENSDCPVPANIKDYEKEFSFGKLMSKIKDTAKKAGLKAIYMALLLYYALESPTITMMDKAIIYGALGYFISPIDLVPDILPLQVYGGLLTNWQRQICSAAFTAGFCGLFPLSC